jgi:hypothetical protein
VSQDTGAVSALEEQTCIEKLAQLFPQASPVRISVTVSAMGMGRVGYQEQAVIEFATSHEVLFTSTLHLEFEDHIRLVNSNGSLDVKATVIAVRYHEGSKAIAARFEGEVENWIVRP